MAPLPADYLERVYAGVLGKLIGVYVGRPFEGWTHQRILNELGPIHYYVHEKCSVPMVVTDDDVSGTFTFVRALEEHGKQSDLSAEDIGKTWLNNVINRRTVFWWGGRGVSTEHTAYLNLKKGIKAPHSGSIQTNGKTVAEQIGAQIFIDGWALVAPGNPTLATKLAEAAGSVSHDGESVYAAKVWAAMEAEAFVSKDIDHLLDIGLQYIPTDSLIATLIADVRRWSKEEGDWKTTRQRIEDKYGYDKFCGFCHVVPNHGIMIMALLYAGHDFHEAIHIINTCGWDTDCNSGNVGCLVAIINGLSAFEDGQDWRGPLADRALISSADGGYSINNAARLAFDIANMGRRLAGEEPLKPPKHGAQFHFSLPGSVQGFQATRNNSIVPHLVKIEQGLDNAGRPGLAIQVSGLTNAADPIEVLTQTFSPPEVREMSGYDLVGSPLVYPGQIVRAIVRADAKNTAPAQVQLALKAYTASDDLETYSSDIVSLAPGTEELLEWVIPVSLGSRSIQALGLVLSNKERLANVPRRLDGTVWLDNLRWDGTPTLVLKPDKAAHGDFWRRSFVNGADIFRTYKGLSVAQDYGEGIVSYGTREWEAYRVTFNGFIINIGGPVGVALRVQGLNRYYALCFTGNNSVTLIKALDEQRIELASVEFDWKLDTPYTITIEAKGDGIHARVGTTAVIAHDAQYQGGGIGLVATEGSIIVDSIEISPLT
ncbi:ADP-ribosylation/Crystallin J1 [Biscogniauxia marginata]|nr:ADP-ribosylation/Crystallin J1 [Biscogniauxia marginata]